MEKTQDKVKALLEDGKSNKEIAEILNINASSVTGHVSNLIEKLKEKDERCKFNWKEIQQYYNQGNSILDCMAKFEFTSAAYIKAKNRGELFLRPKEVIPVACYLTENSTIASAKLKIKLLAAGLLENKCYICQQLPVWNNKPLTLQIDHINGNPTDNRLENLRILCPHCHSQTDTFCKGHKHLKINKFCIDCRCSIDKKSTRCRACAIDINKQSKKNIKIFEISKEELEKLIWEKPTTEIAKMFGVSDKAIEKRCRKFGIKKPQRGYWTKLLSKNKISAL